MCIYIYDFGLVPLAPGDMILQYRIVGRYGHSTVRVPSDTLRTWKWSPTPPRHMFLRAGPGNGPPPTQNIILDG